MESWADNTLSNKGSINGLSLKSIVRTYEVSRMTNEPNTFNGNR